MCLTVNTEAKRNFKRRNKNEKWVTAYKVYNVDTDREILCSIYYPKFIEIKKHGWIESDREGGTTVGTDWLDTKRNFWFEGNTASQVKRGIHVFLDIPTALVVLNRDKNRTIVPLQCRPEDLVGINSIETLAVFTKVFLRKEDLRRALL